MQNEKGKGHENAPGQNQSFTIVLNGQAKTWNDKKISYNEVLVLLYGQVEENDDIIYTITYKKGPDENHEGSLRKGKEVRIHDNMEFYVTRTNRS